MLYLSRSVGAPGSSYLQEAAALPLAAPQCPHYIRPSRIAKLPSRRQRQKGAEWIITLSTFHSIGEPKCPDDVIAKLGSGHITADQNYAVSNLVQKAFPYCRLRPDFEKGKGRGITQVAYLIKTCELIDAAGFVFTDKDIEKLAEAAQPVHIDKVVPRSPKQAAHIDRLDLLTENRLGEYQSLPSRIDNTFPQQGAARSLLPSSHDQEAPLRKELPDTNISGSFAEGDVAQTSDGRLIQGGAFVAQEGPSKWRLIHDRRNSNFRAPSPNWLKVPRLPAGLMVAFMKPWRHEGLRGSGAEGKYVFNLIQNLKKQLLGRNAFGRRFTAGDEPHPGLDKDTYYRQAMNTWGMGNFNSADVAEVVFLKSICSEGAGLADVLLM